MNAVLPFRTNTLALLLVALAAGGCARRLPSGAVIEEPSITDTKAGRNSVRLDLAEALLEAGRVAEAQDVLRTAAGEGADPGEIALLQGMAMDQSGLRGEARTLYLQARKQLPHDARPLRKLAVLDAQDGDVPTAIEELEQATRIDPQDAASWNNLGFLRLSQQDYDGARDALSKAVALDSTVPRYSINLGFALAALEHDADALAAFRSALPEGDAQANLALALEMNGRDRDAAVHYGKALAADPNNSAAQSGLERMTRPEEQP